MRKLLYNCKSGFTLNWREIETKQLQYFFDLRKFQIHLNNKVAKSSRFLFQYIKSCLNQKFFDLSKENGTCLDQKNTVLAYEVRLHIIYSPGGIHTSTLMRLLSLNYGCWWDKEGNFQRQLTEQQPLENWGCSRSTVCFGGCGGCFEVVGLVETAASS